MWKWHTLFCAIHLPIAYIYTWHNDYLSYLPFIMVNASEKVKYSRTPCITGCFTANYSLLLNGPLKIWGAVINSVHTGEVCCALDVLWIIIWAIYLGLNVIYSKLFLLYLFLLFHLRILSFNHLCKSPYFSTRISFSAEFALETTASVTIKLLNLLAPQHSTGWCRPLLILYTSTSS